MFAAPSSTVESLSSSPTSTTSLNHTQHGSKIVVSSKDEFECDKGYTIYVPANVRFRGMNMHLDLKIDEKTLSTTSSEIAKSKLAAPIENEESSSSPSQAQTSVSKDPTVFGISCSYNAVGESVRTADNSKQLPNVSSTTTEQLDPLQFSAALMLINEVSSHSDETPVTSTISVAQEDAEAVVDTTTAPAPEDYIVGSANSGTSPQRKLVDGDSTSERHCKTLSPDRSDYCLPSSSSELLVSIDIESSNHCDLKPSECDKDEESVIHDSRPCSSANLSTVADSISSTAPDGEASGFGLLAKRRRIVAPNFCGFIDNDRGQCKQRAILSYTYCIRHILLDPSAPYRQCQHKRKPKNKKGDFLQCTNAIRTDKTDIFCSTHLIMKGMMQPKTKKSSACLATTINSVSPSTIAASPPPPSTVGLNKAAAFASEDRLMTATDGNSSSFDYGQFSNGDVLGHSRTGCESTSSWDQMSNMSGSMTPSRSALFLQQPSDYSSSTGTMIAQTPPPGNYHSQPQPQQPMVRLGATPRHVAQNSTMETAVEAPNLDANCGAGGAYLAQQTSQRYAGNMSQQFSSEPFVVGLMSAYETQVQHGQINSPAFHTNGQQLDKNSDCMHLQMSRLSKQHPHLAAKLLQSSYPNAPVAYYPPPAGSPAMTMMISPEKQPPYINMKPPPKLSRTEMAQPVQPMNSALRQPVVLDDGDITDSVKIYSPHGQQQQQPMAFLLHQGLGSIRMAPTPTDDQMKQTIRYSEMPPPQQRLISSTYSRYPNVNPNRYDHQNLPVQCLPQQISSQQLSKILSRPAYVQYQTRLMDVISAHCIDISSFVDAEPKPVKYRIAEDIDDLGVDEEARICRDYLNSSVINPPAGAGQPTRRRTPKSSISLRQKRHKVRITGAFRNVPLVDSMCKIIEHHDFDSTDLFPLGLEPSDDESSSEDSFPIFNGDRPSESSLQDGVCKRNRIDLYLLKKKLRLESSRLVQGAKIAMPIIEAAKIYKNCVGAALRTRQMNRRRESIIGVERQRYRPCQFERTDPEKARKAGGCQRVCLPASNYCADHILYGVEQKLFTYCKRVCCGRPVLCSDVLLLDGMCRQHYDESVAPPPSKIQTSNQNGINKEFSTSFESRNECTNGHYRSDQNSSKFFSDNVDQSNDDVVEDVSLASVAKDLGLNGHELTDMLERLPVDDSLDDQDIGEDDEEGFFESIKADEDVSGLTLGHNWADVEQFLLSEGYSGAENSHSKPPPASTSGVFVDGGRL